MGEMAEYYLAKEMEEMATDEILSFIHRARKGRQRIVWVTNDMREIEIKDMTTSHIKNSLTKCKRDRWREEAIPYLEEELKKRGEL